MPSDALNPLTPEDLGEQFVQYLVTQAGGFFSQIMELAKRLAQDEGDEFFEGARFRLHSLVDTLRPDSEPDDAAAAFAGIIQYFEEWLMSARLDANESWQRQMAESDEAMTSGELGAPVTAKEMRRTLVS